MTTLVSRQFNSVNGVFQPICKLDHLPHLKTTWCHWCPNCNCDQNSQHSFSDVVEAHPQWVHLPVELDLQSWAMHAKRALTIPSLTFFSPQVQFLEFPFLKMSTDCSSVPTGSTSMQPSLTEWLLGWQECSNAMGQSCALCLACAQNCNIVFSSLVLRVFIWNNGTILRPSFGSSRLAAKHSKLETLIGKFLKALLLLLTRQNMLNTSIVFKPKVWIVSLKFSVFPNRSSKGNWLVRRSTAYGIEFDPKKSAWAGTKANKRTKQSLSNNASQNSMTSVVKCPSTSSLKTSSTLSTNFVAKIWIWLGRNWLSLKLISGPEKSSKRKGEEESRRLDYPNLDYPD